MIIVGILRGIKYRINGQTRIMINMSGKAISVNDKSKIKMMMLMKMMMRKVKPIIHSVF